MSASPFEENGCTLSVVDGGGGGTAHFIRAGSCGGRHTCSEGHFVCGKWHKDGRIAAFRVLLCVAVHQACTDSVDLRPGGAAAHMANDHHFLLLLFLKITLMACSVSFWTAYKSDATQRGKLVT